jgi:hypothetical protein
MSTIRGEVTGRKTGSKTGNKPTSPNLADIAHELARLCAGPPVAYTIEEFCRAHRISVTLYYELKKAGLTPAEKQINSRVIITTESAREWRERSDDLITTT